MKKFSSNDKRESITTCRDCGAKDLYLQKTFPRKIGIPIVVIGIIASFWTYGLSLLVVALIDFIFFHLSPWMLVCYRCHAEHRGFAQGLNFKEFDRHTDELYRYGGN
ncbi:MAG: hypothetical protein HYS22_05795 [Deltaproteobacteria bacterium]|nr:hypothetical protein [Deltaproteobacteria bacterium]